MSTPKRESAPPPRPPAPKGMAKRSASSNSIKKSFKLLEEDEEDEEDLTVLTGEFDKKLDKTKSDSLKGESLKGELSRETTPVKLPLGETKSIGLNPRSKSFDDDKSAINVSRIKQNFVDISSGLKDKLTKKWEEISAEINSGETEELEKSDFDKTNGTKVRQEVKNSDTKGNISDENKSVIDKTSASEISQETSPIKKKVPPPAKLHRTPEELETAAIAIIEDFYSNEPKEDFTGMPTLPQSNSYGEFPRQRSTLRKLMKSKNTKPATAPASPVSMSKLLTKKEVEDVSPLQDDKVSNSREPTLDPNENSSSVGIKTTSKAYPKSTKEMVVVPVKKLSLGAVILFFYMILPLPSYLSGMVMGVFIASLGWGVYMWLTKPALPRPVPEKVPLSQLPPMVLPEMKDVVAEDGVFQGWMNEIPNYSPEKYHINQTHSVLIDLEGTTLRLRRPKTNISKRAMWDEGQIPTPSFIHQRHLNLESSKVFLLPPGLVKKRIWSKKYPICIAIAQQSDNMQITKDQTPDSEIDFEIVTEQKCSDSTLFLFARTCREKEDWYKRFTAAAKGQPLPSHLKQIRKCFSSKPKQHQRHSSSSSLDSTFQHKRQGSTDSTSSTGSSSPMREADDNLTSKQTTEAFIRYMARLMPRELYDTRSSPTHKQASWDFRGPVDCEDSIIWLNAIISRLFWDFLHHKYFKDKVLEKLQRKLSKIHIPYFIEELKITNIDLGDEMPIIRRGNRPYFDEQGFWVDLDVNYDGGFQMTIETKVNLMRLKQTSDKPEFYSQKSAITNSDEEDSAESSSDEEEESSSPGVEEGASGGRASRKILRYLGKITQSKYFQSATEIKYIKKKMEEVSNTPLVLTVEVRVLSGTLTLNVPPPPTDRLWYGFRGNPKLQLVAKPKVGAREVTVTHITEWIEKKLSTEFQRTFVFPNMDDQVVQIFSRFIPDGVDPDSQGQTV